ncbi:hypothetical protein NX868_09565 [Burkholderia thailandensis]|uniref:hypothetical protein n=1 Tax=Burkholderia thailandensis TaxID=57975 RepID=UPI0010E5CFF4|nr:hypothetical protein [Burkholderia thailandensis]MCS3392876.1 hypothetical protein [Burkholderia thailandensis]MCS6425652.1 hypothetical protein [Burkholderia thailandensis]MCS6453302.1 hypothetical protein [Burkholderia thailandensis]MCS6464910.1 hypothetical protein [Burkholderia thailandensis]MCS6482524.1 hypothetical protein [Burkholderia thailandensis]
MQNLGIFRPFQAETVHPEKTEPAESGRRFRQSTTANQMTFRRLPICVEIARRVEPALNLQ